jgi:predicted nucleic acid-binding protein
LFDADVFISYIGGDDLLEFSEKAVTQVLDGQISAYVSSIIYDDIITALRSKEMPLEKVIRVLAAMVSIPHTPIPLDPATNINAMRLYMKHMGSRRLHYFDSFHVATAIKNNKPLLTSDKYILENQEQLGLKALDLKFDI